MGKSRARMPAFYRQSIQNAVNQQINIGKSKHRTTLNREAIGQVFRTAQLPRHMISGTGARKNLRS